MDIIRMSLLSAVGGGGSGAQIGTKSVTANGTYQAIDDNLDGWRTFTVAVPLTGLEVLANGVYTADSGGYNVVDVKVKTWEEEYQEALDQIEELEDAVTEYSECCEAIAAMLGADANCESMKKKAAEIVPIITPPVDLPARGPDNTEENTTYSYYAALDSERFAIVSERFDEWTFVRGGWHRGGAYFNKHHITVKIYDANTGEVTGTRNFTRDIWVYTDNGGLNPPDDPGWSKSTIWGHIYNDIDSNTGKPYMYSYQDGTGNGVLHWVYTAWTVTGDPPHEPQNYSIDLSSL